MESPVKSLQPHGLSENKTPLSKQKISSLSTVPIVKSPPVKAQAAVNSAKPGQTHTPEKQSTPFKNPDAKIQSVEKSLAKQASSSGMNSPVAKKVQTSATPERKDSSSKRTNSLAGVLNTVTGRQSDELDLLIEEISGKQKKDRAESKQPPIPSPRPQESPPLVNGTELVSKGSAENQKGPGRREPITAAFIRKPRINAKESVRHVFDPDQSSEGAIKPQENQTKGELVKKTLDKIIIGIFLRHCVDFLPFLSIQLTLGDAFHTLPTDTLADSNWAKP